MLAKSQPVSIAELTVIASQEYAHTKTILRNPRAWLAFTTRVSNSGKSIGPTGCASSKDEIRPL